MHDIAFAIMLVGMLVFFSHYFTHIFNKTRIPDAFFLIVVGLILGPLTGWVLPEKTFGKTDEIFTSIALIVILFEGGLELNFQSLSRSLRSAMLLALINFIGIIFLTFLIYLFSEIISLGFFQFNWGAAIIIGIMLANTSSAVVIPLLKQTKLNDNSKTTLIVESALSDVLSIVIALAVFKTMQESQTQFGSVFGNLLSSFLVAVFIGIIGGLVWSSLLGRIRQIENSMFTTLAFVFLVYGFSEILHFSGAIAALSFGITLGNAKLIRLPLLTKRNTFVLHDIEKDFFREIVFLLKTFFFVYLGLSVKFSEIDAVAFGVLLTFGVLLLRIPVVRFAADKKTLREDVRKISVMIPKGLAAAVLATVPLQINLAKYTEYVNFTEGLKLNILSYKHWIMTNPTGIIPYAETIQNISFVVIFFSILVTTIFLYFVDQKPLRSIYDKFFAKFSNSEE